MGSATSRRTEAANVFASTSSAWIQKVASVFEKPTNAAFQRIFASAAWCPVPFTKPCAATSAASALTGSPSTERALSFSGAPLPEALSRFLCCSLLTGGEGTNKQ